MITIIWNCTYNSANEKKEREKFVSLTQCVLPTKPFQTNEQIKVKQPHAGDGPQSIARYQLIQWKMMSIGLQIP